MVFAMAQHSLGAGDWESYVSHRLCRIFHNLWGAEEPSWSLMSLSIWCLIGYAFFGKERNTRMVLVAAWSFFFFYYFDDRALGRFLCFFSLPTISCFCSL